MTLASKITLLRVAFIPVYMVFMYLSGGVANSWQLWTALAIFVFASLTDYVDGEIARKHNQVSDFGKFLDPLADKLLVIAAMTMFCEWGMLPAWALMLVLTREFAVTGLRLIAVGKGTVIKNSILLQNTYTGEDVYLNCVVTDKDVTIKNGKKQKFKKQCIS